MLMLLLTVVLVTVIPAFLISLAAVAWLRSVANRLGLMDKPGLRKIHTTPIPLGGGLGIWAGLVGTFSLGTLVLFFANETYFEGWFPELLQTHRQGLLNKSSEIWWLILGGTVLTVLGLVDDRRGLPWQLRLFVEFLVAALVVYWQGLQLTAFIGWPWLTSLLSILWIVALINSFNMLDNMDGLSSGVAAIISSMLAAMLLLNPDPVTRQPQLFVAAMLLILSGSLLGFLKHNWPPAKIFMGDAGSYLVGYWIAISTLLTTYTGYHSSHPHAILAPLCALAIPLYDMVSVIWIRLSEGRSPFDGDKRHFSHRLVELGMSKTQAVLTIYLATATCCLAALMLNRTDWLGAIIIVMMVFAMLSLIAVLENLSRGEP
ncbi:MAG: MraY family glycosyltransferase [Pirellulaceae bacterium]|nr:MraY family glycosyltransferase [Pirellulaceae bacterium]